MSVDQFISHILNINKNDILQLVSLPQPDDSLIIKLKLQAKRLPCPVCGRSPIVHGYTLKKLVHSTFSNRKCFIYYYQRRYKCISCELTYSEPNPFSKVGENLTHETKLNILKALKDIGITYTQVAKQYNVSVTEVIKIFDKHVNIHRKPLPSVLAIDEHYFPHTDFSAAKYCCVLMNFLTGELIDVLPDRRKAYLARYFTSIKLNTSDYVLNISELDNVKYISMDLSYNFKDIASRYFPHALVCADSFHVIRHLTEAFKKIRLRCMRTTQNAALLYLLGKFKFVFRHGAHLDNEPRYNKSLG